MVHIDGVLDRLYEKLNIKDDAEFSRKYGTPKPTISTWRKRNTIPWEKIEDIVQNANLSLDYVVLGKEVRGKKSQETHLFDLVSAKVSAGAGLESYEVETIDRIQIDDYFFRTQPDPKSTFIMEVEGDSMNPTLRYGDCIVIDKKQHQIKDNGIYVINVDGELMVKRLQKKMNGDVLIISDNKFYTTESISVNSQQILCVVGRVVLKIERY